MQYIPLTLMKNRIQSIIYSVLFTLCFFPSIAFSLSYDLDPTETEGSLGLKGDIYQLITGTFGALVIIICGLGGFAALIMMRQGKAGKNASAFGIVLLCIAAFVFAYRILIISGAMGHEYGGW